MTLKEAARVYRDALVQVASEQLYRRGGPSPEAKAALHAAHTQLLRTAVYEDCTPENAAVLDRSGADKALLN